MNRIFKYTLDLKPRSLVQMPATAKILSVYMQDDMPILAAMIDTEDTKIVPRIIRTVTTGEEFAGNCEYIGTIQAGSPTWYVAHVFEQHAALDTSQVDVVSSRFKDDQRKIYAEIVPKLVEAT